MSKKKYAPSLKRIEEAFARLQTLAQRKKNNGVLPSYTWLNTHGHFADYDLVRQAGWLGKFKRAMRKTGPKKK